MRGQAYAGIGNSRVHPRREILLRVRGTCGFPGALSFSIRVTAVAACRPLSVVLADGVRRALTATCLCCSLRMKMFVSRICCWPPSLSKSYKASTVSGSISAAYQVGPCARRECNMSVSPRGRSGSATSASTGSSSTTHSAISRCIGRQPRTRTSSL